MMERATIGLVPRVVLAALVVGLITQAQIPQAHAQMPQELLQMPQAHSKMPQELLQMPQALLQMPQAFAQMPQAHSKMPQALLQNDPAVSVRSQRYAQWPVLVNPFESTGGGSVMIGDYAPVVAGGTCRTDFAAIPPGGPTCRNSVIRTATPTQGGTLCKDGQ